MATFHISLFTRAPKSDASECPRVTFDKSLAIGLCLSIHTAPAEFVDAVSKRSFPDRRWSDNPVAQARWRRL